MGETNSYWLRDILLIPLIIGLFIAIVTYGLPIWLNDGKVLSYSTVGPEVYLSTESIGSPEIVVNGTPTSNIYLYRVRLVNTGDEPISNVPVRLVFNTKESDFKIFSITHNTKPKFEFGKIDIDSTQKSNMRFVYELLNQNNEDVITIATNKNPSLQFYSKQKGMKVAQIVQDEERELSDWFARTSTIIALIASVLTMGLKFLSEKIQLWPLTSLRKKDDAT